MKFKTVTLQMACQPEIDRYSVTVQVVPINEDIQSTLLTINVSAEQYELFSMMGENLWTIEPTTGRRPKPEPVPAALSESEPAIETAADALPIKTSTRKKK